MRAVTTSAVTVDAADVAERARGWVTNSFPASCSTMSLAVFGPMPDTRRKAASSSAATAWAMASGSRCSSTARADFGPTPVTPQSSSNARSSSGPGKPKSVSESSRTTSDVSTVASDAFRCSSACRGVTETP